jgi:hypothetical protein
LLRFRCLDSSRRIFFQIADTYPDVGEDRKDRCGFEGLIHDLFIGLLVGLVNVLYQTHPFIGGFGLGFDY